MHYYETDAYNNTFAYMKKKGLAIDSNDELEVYEEVFQDPAGHTFSLLIPIK